MKVLFGVEGSEGSWEALEAGTRLTHADRDHVVVYYAPPVIRVETSRQAGEATQRARQALVDSVFEEARRRLPGTLAARAEWVVGSGDPRSEISQVALERGANLVVVGARTGSRWTRRWPGSVSRHLARHCPVPLLVARRKPDKASDGRYRVLWAVDGVPTAGEVTALVCQLAWPADARGRLLHVVETLFSGELPDWLVERANYARDEELARSYLQEMETAKKRKFAELAEYAKQLPTGFTHDPPVVLDGYPAERILETATADDADLVIVGAKEKSALARFMLGSTAERVLVEAQCSVLLVHQHARPE